MGGWLRNKTATVVDLFAGTGGMGLATLLSSELRDRAQIVYVGELDPDCVDTIQLNYRYYARHIGSPEQLPSVVSPTDVSSRSALTQLDAISRRHGGVALFLAGPPCQGFSQANSRSRDRANPLNLLALRTIEAVKAASPKIAIIENVPGIRTMQSAKRSTLSVSEHIELELSRSGYFVHTTLLDAADYGVPQHRLRSFTIAISLSIIDAFDTASLVPPPQFGPGRRFPYRTVRDAFGDLPSIPYGSNATVADYGQPAQSKIQRDLRRYSRRVFDHVTSRHAAYVLDRYKAIPVGGNWKSIRRKLRNYSNPGNTHTNIYHRLDPDKPSRTIGNFRKAMTVHPWEHRGLSLREAARLQTLPDWLRFFEDDPDFYHGQLRGLGVRQQQVGNAVCFDLTRQLVAHLFSRA